MDLKKKFNHFVLSAFVTMFLSGCCTFAGEADLVVPNFSNHPQSFNLLLLGIGISFLGLIYGLIEFVKESFSEYSLLMKYMAE